MTHHFVNQYQLQPQQQQNQQQASQPNSQSANSTPQGGNQPNRPVIERGASWSFNETRILLSLWGQDMVQRQLTNSKRTRHVWEKIAERIREHGFERTADQVRTRVFNMIAEYRRILKNPTPERKKKCIFFDALHKIYQAKDTNGVKAALNNYEEDYNLEPLEFNSQDENENGGDGGDADNSGTDNEDRSEIFAYAMSPSQALGQTMQMNGHHHGMDDDSTDGQMHIVTDETPIGAPPAKRLRSDSTMSSLHQQQFASFDSSSSALLIDRMFAHLAKETEVMREWVHLERERLSQEVSRRREENEREERREKVFLATLTKMQDQMFAYLAKSSQNGSECPNSPTNGSPHNDSQDQLLDDH
ncbi:Zinc finger and SCAN domain-containing protein 29 [Halotydeus destructor]|nr:Zinc finger and SCAN domain-containing protein 29 [Halotydeus destructor]